MRTFLQLIIFTQLKTQLMMLCFAVASISPIYATNYYVSKIGNNNNSGTSLATAFVTIQKAHDVSLPGDTIWVADGTYTEEVVVTRSGNSSSNITYKAINKWDAKVFNTWYNCFTVKASYITIDGFDLMAPATYGSGIGAMPNKTSGTVFIHHLLFINNKCHDSGQGGVSVQDCDYVTISNNLCYKTGWLMPYSGSGISIYGRYTFDNNTGFHYKVNDNICYLNNNGPTTNKTDGNGIIIDDLRNTQTENHNGLAQNLTYTTQAVLVENNLCYSNGGKGIQLAWSNNVILRNNTLYGNCTRPDQQTTWNGELSAMFSSNITAVNNICVSTIPNSGAKGIFAGAGAGIGIASNLNYYNNITFSTFNPASNAAGGQGVTITVAGVNNNKCAVDPLFVNPGADFRLQSNSPAIDAGTAAYGLPMLDLVGTARMQGSSVDIGTYESVPLVPLAVNLLSFTVKRTAATIAVLKWKTTQEVNFNSFDLEKAADGQSFAKITSIPSGNNSINQYQYIDDNAIEQHIHYRLKMIDKDGTFRYSAIAVLKMDINKNSVGEFFPNPIFNQPATIKITAKQTGVWSISAFKLTGQSFNLQQNNLVKGSNIFKINVNVLSAGFYYLKLENNGEVYIRKLLKM